MLEGMTSAPSALQTVNTLNSNLKFESERVGRLLSIECVLGVLVGWCLMTLERCSCIILLSYKNHEIPNTIVEIHLDPKQFFEVVHLLHYFVVVAASIVLLLWQVLLCSAPPHW